MTILENVILEQLPGAEEVRIEGDYAFVLVGDVERRYALSREAKRLVLLEREGRFLDIPLGEVTLLSPGDEEE